MALELVTVKARTRGKTPKEFTYKGVGRLTERDVMSDEKDPSGKGFLPVKDAAGNPVKVHDIDARGITSDMNDVFELYTTHLPAENDAEGNPIPAQQRIIDGAINWFNALARKNASPVVEVEKEDELTPIIAELVAGGFLAAENEATWRRAVTTGANATEMPRVDYVKLTKEYKTFAKAQATV